MTSADAVFREAAAERRIASVPLSHLSIELGHLYMEDFAAGPQHLRQYFQQLAPWVNVARQACADSLQSQRTQHGQQGRRARARVSTCFLVDDYFTRFSSPAELAPELVSAAREAGLEIDYLARESGCAHADGVELARLVEGRLVTDPPPGTNGSRPPATEVGWLCNGQRSPASDAAEAMDAIRRWTPPVQNAARRHSIFLDVELWDESNGRRVWSCAFLAAVWQLLRLGMLRHDGEGVTAARQWDGAFPEDWDEIPAVTQLNPAATPFGAYRTLSILSTRFLPIEHAVRTILSQVAIDRDVLDQVMTRSRGEGVLLPLDLVDRIDYVFAGISAGQPQ
ncbi:MAG: SCO2522 family protein [Actinomycetota bacterium]|nr:SCO2522 family protein [Actinomycetota bacterium]